MCDYIVLKTGYTSRLLAVGRDIDTVEKIHADEKNVFRFPLPLERGNDDDEHESSFVHWDGDHTLWGRMDNEPFLTPGEESHDFIKLNHAASPYEVVLISDTVWGEGTYKFTEDAALIADQLDDYGIIVFRRKDRGQMDLSTFIDFSYTTFINYCAMFSAFTPPYANLENFTTPCKLKLKTLNEKTTGRKTVLIAEYDSESG